MNHQFFIQLVLGLWAGGLLNAIWYYWWAYLGAREDQPLGKYRWPALSALEHYHWATVLYILGFRLEMPALLGVATVLLLDESVGQVHKFALGSGHFLESALLEILILACWAVAELCLKLVAPTI